MANQVGSTTCTKGHIVQQGQAFCPTCGESIAQTPGEPQDETPTPSRTASPLFSALSLVRANPIITAGVTGGVIIVLIVIIVFSGGGGRTLSVKIGDNRSDGCESYDQSHFVGGELLLKDASGTILGKQVISGAGEVGSGEDGPGSGCYWNLEFADVKGSDAYILDVSLPQGEGSLDAPVQQELNFSQSELESQGWELDLGINR